MTKKLEELLDMAPAKEVSENTDIIPEPEKTVSHIQEHTPEDIQRAIAKADKIDEALPMVKDLSLNDQEMDEIATTAKDTFQDLMDLGMQVDSRFSGDIFSVASNMLNHAITAKTAKLNKKLKMIDLQLKKATLDQRQAKMEEKIDNIPLGDGAQNLDRNELLRVLTSKNTEE